MVLPTPFRPSSTSLLRDEIKHLSAPLFKGRSGNNNRASSLGAIPLSPPASEDASSSYQYPLTSPEVENPDNFESAVEDATLSGYQGSIHKNDIVIAIMGLTGAGKSSFVTQATGSMEVLIGHDLTSRTRVVQPVRCTHPDGLGNIVLVDTPGFDDTRLSDAEILRTIANWLKEAYQNNIKLAGILYLHRISDVRMAGTPLRNLTVFKDLCGDDNMKNIILVTTMWDEVEGQLGSEREEELVSSFWKDMMSFGSRTCRSQGTYDSAWEIINQLDLKRPPQERAPLQIQQEMVDRSLPLHETAAARTMFRSLGEEFKKVWEKIRDRARRPIGPVRRPGGFRQTILRRSSIRSSSSDASRSVISLTDTFSIGSGVSTHPSSIADSTTSGCSAVGRREALSAMTRGLKIVYEVAALLPVPMLRGAIGTVLCIAKLIEEMNGTHHAISQVVQNSGWLLEEIAQYAMKSKLSDDMKKVLNSLQRQLKHLQNIVKKVEKRDSIARFLLHDADILAITACNDSIKMIYDKLGMKIAMENQQAIARLQDEMKLLRNNKESRKCQCGSWPLVAHEENEEFFDAASHASGS